MRFTYFRIKMDDKVGEHRYHGKAMASRCTGENKTKTI